MAPGICVTSFRLLFRRCDLGQLTSMTSRLRLKPLAPLSLSSWQLSARMYSSENTFEDKSGEIIHKNKKADSSTSTATTTYQPKSDTINANRTKSAKIDIKDSDTDLSSLTIVDLKAQLRQQGVSTTGNKSVLIKRLRQQMNAKKVATSADETETDDELETSKKTPTTTTTNFAHTSTAGISEGSHAAKDKLSITQSATDTKLEITETSKTTAAAATPVKTLSDEHDDILVNHSITAATNISQTKNDTIDTRADINVQFIQGLPHLTVPLPSRNEKCMFVLKPVSHKVGDLINMLKAEDRGIDRATVLNKHGVRIASTCSIESLMDDTFWLQINDQKFEVVPPKRKKIEIEDLNKMGDIRSLVAQLYEALHVGEYHLQKEQELAQKLEDLKFNIEPLEKEKQNLSAQAERKTNIMSWVGLGLMSMQFGILARLTWWEYSWDIMEPVTYFVTYGTAIVFYAYYCITRMEYNLNDVRDRNYLIAIHKSAKKKNFDFEEYNHLRRQIADVEYDLRRLRDPLNLQLPSHVMRSQSFIPPRDPDNSGNTPDSSSKDSSSSTLDGKCGKSIGSSQKKSIFKLPFLDNRN